MGKKFENFQKIPKLSKIPTKISKLSDEPKKYANLEIPPPLPGNICML